MLKKVIYFDVKKYDSRKETSITVTEREKFVPSLEKET